MVIDIGLDNKRRTSQSYHRKKMTETSVRMTEKKRLPTALNLHRNNSPRPNRSHRSLRTLLQCLLEVPNSLDGDKLSLVGMRINSLSDPPPLNVAAKVKVLYLSNNDLDDLEGIGDFKNLKALSIANNSFHYLGSLRPLRCLTHLEKLSTEGNSINGMPYFREYILGLCPMLVSLDGSKISLEERASAKSNSRKIANVFHQLRSNELRLLVLDHLQKLTHVHSQFFSMLGKFRYILLCLFPPFYFC
jgi:hypothetical protein